MTLADLTPEERQSLKNEIKAELLQDLKGEKVHAVAVRQLRQKKDIMVSQAIEKFLSGMNYNRGDRDYSYVRSKVETSVKSLANFAFRIAVKGPRSAVKNGTPTANVETDEDLAAYMQAFNSILEAMDVLCHYGLPTIEER